METSN
jgi:hypothetical protein